MAFYPMGRDMRFCEICCSRKHKTAECFDELEDQEKQKERMDPKVWRKMWKKRMLKMDKKKWQQKK